MAEFVITDADGKDWVIDAPDMATAVQAAQQMFGGTSPAPSASPAPDAEAAPQMPETSPLPPHSNLGDRVPLGVTPDLRGAGRMVAQGVGTAGGIAAGTATSPVTGPVGPIVGGGAGNVAAGQLYDALLDRLTGTQRRPPLASTETAIDAVAGAAGPAVAAVARPFARLVSGVSREAAARVDGAIARAVERAKPERASAAEVAAVNREATEAGAVAYREAMANGVTPEMAEAAALQAGREAAQAAARRTWQEAERAGRVPPKEGGRSRRNPEVTAEAQTAAERARDEAIARSRQETRIASPEAAERARETAREGIVNQRFGEMQARARETTAATASEAASRAATRATRKAGDWSAIIGGIATGNLATAGLIFGAGRTISAGQRAMARRLLQSEGVRRWVQETGPAFGTRSQIITSLGAMAANGSLDTRAREDARNLRSAIIQGAIVDARNPTREEATGRFRATDGRFLPDPETEPSAPDGRDTEE